jgi:hypothetical protein
MYKKACRIASGDVSALSPTKKAARGEQCSIAVLVNSGSRGGV